MSFLGIHYILRPSSLPGNTLGCMCVYTCVQDELIFVHVHRVQDWVSSSVASLSYFWRQTLPINLVLRDAVFSFFWLVLEIQLYSPFLHSKRFTEWVTLSPPRDFFEALWQELGTHRLTHRQHRHHFYLCCGHYSDHLIIPEVWLDLGGGLFMVSNTVIKTA